MKIIGTDLQEHPLAKRNEPGLEPRRYRDPSGAVVLAAMATDFGTIERLGTTYGFAPGDYILTEDPPRSAWVISGAIFEKSFLAV